MAMMLGAGQPSPPKGSTPEESRFNPHQLMFVPPPAEGVISLAVYDGSGRLVRLLAKAAPIESFKAGLNGLLVDWDGNDDQGKPVPPGRYYARGVVIGEEVDVSGEAFHFNDFADNTGSPRPSEVLDATLYTKGQPAMLVLAAGKSEVLIADQKGTEPQRILVNVPGEPRLKTAGVNLLLIGADRAEAVDPKTERVRWKVDGRGLRGGDSDGVKTLLVGDEGLVLLTGETRQVLQTPATDLITHAALLRSTAVLAADDGKLWSLEGLQAVPLALNDPKPLVDLAGGREDTVWLLLKEGDQALVRQLDVRSRQVRDLELPPDLRGASRISAARDGDALLFLIRNETGERVVGLRYQNTKADQSIWEKWFDRSRQNFSGFDLKNGKVVASADQSPSPSVIIKPVNNPLENAPQAAFQLAVYADSSGAWVVNHDGLPICQVSETKGARQVKWLSDGQDGIRVFVSDGRVVEEYHVTGLENLYRFDAGPFD